MCVQVHVYMYIYMYVHVVCVQGCICAYIRGIIFVGVFIYTSIDIVDQRLVKLVRKESIN